MPRRRCVVGRPSSHCWEQLLDRVDEELHASQQSHWNGRSLGCTLSYWAYQVYQPQIRSIPLEKSSELVGSARPGRGTMLDALLLVA